ncbi:hypothetical protein DK412_21960 [Methylobacterium sp. 17Sr1-1]|nr:hypothetical protein DK412_21960 [Methylobacterium sp. 17Sr1-1]
MRGRGVWAMAGSSFPSSFLSRTVPGNLWTRPVQEGNTVMRMAGAFAAATPRAHKFLAAVLSHHGGAVL